MLYVLKIFHFHAANPPWSSGQRNVLDHLGRGLESYCHSYNFFFQTEETCTFMNISSLKYHLSVIYKSRKQFYLV